MINIAIIGCGDMAVLHAEAIHKLDSVKIHACADLDFKKAIAFAQRFQINKCYKDEAPIFTDPSIDAVYITSTTSSHLALFEQAIAEGKHIFMEKPLTLSLDDARAMLRLAANSNVIALTAFKFRFYSMIRKARDLVQNPFMVSVHIIDDPWPENFWANQPGKGGGNVISQGVHGADLLRFLVGDEPETVFGVGKNYHQPTGVFDNLSATFKFANGVAGNLVVGDCGTAPVASKFMVQVCGKQGTVTVVDRLKSLYFKSMHENKIYEWHGEEDGIFKENEIFLELMKGKEVEHPNIRDGYAAQAMIDVAIQSARQNHSQTISLEVSRTQR